MRTRTRVLAVSTVSALFLSIAASAAHAGVVEGSKASAVGVHAHSTLAGFDFGSIGPTPSAQVPDQQNQNKVKNTVYSIEYPEGDASLVGASVLKAIAERTTGDLPTAHAQAQVNELTLFEGGGGALVKADVIDSVSVARCLGPNKAEVGAEGSRLVGLEISGQKFEHVPPPNFEVFPLVYDGGTPADPKDDYGVRIILNEQKRASQGTGLIVTMIHAFLYSPAQTIGFPSGVFADIKIAEAKSTVWCGDATPPSKPAGGESAYEGSKIVTSTTSDTDGALGPDGRATAFRSDEVTWKITISNKGDRGCSLLVVTDNLPQHFTFARSSGNLTDAVAGGPTINGQDLTWRNALRWDLPAGGRLTETVVAKVNEDAPFGTYTNLVTIEESTCSSFTQGLLGPVEVIPKQEAPAPPKTLVKGTKVRAAPKKLPATGLAADPVTLALTLIVAGIAIRRRTARA